MLAGGDRGDGRLGGGLAGLFTAPADTTMTLARMRYVPGGHADVSRHVVVVGRDFAWGTVLVSRTPFRPEEIEAIASMALGALGIETDEDEVNKVMGCKPMQGATWEQAIACFQHWGMRATLVSPCLRTMARAHRPSPSPKSPWSAPRTPIAARPFPKPASW